jgi:hypothetical protein
MNQNFQKAAIAMLLCGPSTLHDKWLENDKPARDAELTRLGLSPAAETAAKNAMDGLNGKQELFAAMAQVLKFNLWAGGEPHPDDAGAASIMGALRQLDGD